MLEPKFTLAFFQHKTRAAVTMNSDKENIKQKWQYLVLDNILYSEVEVKTKLTYSIYSTC